MKTRITELLGIKYPVIQGPMAWVSFPPLVAAVSNAGGLGILGAAPMTPDELRENVRMTKELTDKPFGVNFIPESPQIEELLDIIIEEGVRVASYGIGNPKKIIERTRPHGIINMPTMGAVRHAVRAQENGADAVIVQGTEAGGHNSNVATMVLVPAVVGRVDIPVVAAGGIGDARGFAAALALGAEGVSMGTRFIVTQESPVPPNIKSLIIRSSEEDTVLVSGIRSGLRARMLRNKLAETILETKDLTALLTEGEPPSRVGRLRMAMVDGDEENGSISVGQVCGLIHDIPTCRELIEGIVAGAEKILESARSKLTP